MSHGLYNNGSRFISQSPAWHQLGKITGTDVTRAQVVETICYPVTKEQLSGPYGLVESWGMYAHIDGQYNFLAPVGKDYTPIPAADGLEIVDLLMSQAPELTYETAGVLGKGEKYWALVDLRASFTVGNAEHTQYLLYQGSHDGSTRNSYGLVDTCVVCQNTLAMANNEKLSQLLKISHTKSAPVKMEQAKAALVEMHREAGDLQSTLTTLSTLKVEKNHVETLFNKLFPIANQQKGSSTRRNNILAEILESYDAANEEIFPQTAGSAYNLLQAVTGFVDHTRGQDDSRAEVSLFGTGNAMKQSAVEIIMEQASSMSPIYTRAWSHREQGSLLDTIIANG